MNFLKQLDFSEEDIEFLSKKINKTIIEHLSDHNELVIENINFLKQLGIINYKDIFKTYPDMFLNDNKFFSTQLNKYDQEDLIKHLQVNVHIFPQLL